MSQLHKLAARALVPLAVASSLSLTTAPDSLAATNSCSVRNAQTSVETDDLQFAIDEAQAFDALVISGVCRGSLSVAKSIVLIGQATTEHPVAKVFGDRRERALTILGDSTTRITVIDLSIGHSSYQAGGGVFLRDGSLNLAGTSTVSSNRAPRGGGILMLRGELTLRDSAVVYGNGSKTAGGIFARHGHVALLGRAQVVGNAGDGIRAYGPVRLARESKVIGNAGFGVNASRRLVMRGKATIRGNVAGGISTVDGQVSMYRSSLVVDNAGDGGIFSPRGVVELHQRARVVANNGLTGAGIYTDTGTVLLDGRSIVGRNTAKYFGGGIHNVSGVTTLSGHAAVVGNSAGHGGGIASFDGSITLQDRAEVVRNTAIYNGGGIYSDTAVITVLGQALLAHNTPNDCVGTGC